MIPEDATDRAVEQLFITLEVHLDDPGATYSRGDDQVDIPVTVLAEALLNGGWVPPRPDIADSDPDERRVVIWVEFGRPRRPRWQR